MLYLIESMTLNPKNLLDIKMSIQNFGKLVNIINNSEIRITALPVLLSIKI